MDSIDHFRNPRGLGLVALLAVFLGVVVGGHSVMLWSSASLLQSRWCLYAVFLACFHLGEFLLTARNQPRDVTADSFLLNHSRAYGVAFAAAVVEFWVSAAISPASRNYLFSLVLGATLCAAGQALRAVAMLTASSNFTHLVQVRRRAGHELVTRGVYAVFRHPAYVGWFVWSVGTQVLLGNTLCTVAYAYASWRFFADRIPEEEDALIDFFGKDYVVYAKMTWGFPGVNSPASECSFESAELRRLEAERHREQSHAPSN